MKHSLSLLLTCLLLSLATHSLRAEMRDFTNLKGDTIRAELIEVDGGKATIKRDDGREFTVPITMFSKDDREYIAKWAKEKKEKGFTITQDSRLDITVKRKRDNDLNNHGDPDNRVVVFTPSIDIENHDIEEFYPNTKGTLFLFGESVFTRDELKVLSREDFEISIPRNDKASWTGTRFVNEYDDNASNGHSFGHKYEGYVVILYNKDDSVAYVKASRTAWEKNVKKYYRAQKDEHYNRELTAKVEPVYEYGY